MVCRGFSDWLTWWPHFLVELTLSCDDQCDRADHVTRLVTTDSSPLRGSHPTDGWMARALSRCPHSPVLTLPGAQPGVLRGNSGHSARLHWHGAHVGGDRHPMSLASRHRSLIRSHGWSETQEWDLQPSRTFCRQPMSGLNSRNCYTRKEGRIWDAVLISNIHDMH